MTSNAPAPAEPAGYKWIGKPVPRKEDAALLSGRAQFIDDIEPVANLKHAAILRSPHAHARILKIETAKARALAGVTGIVTGAEVAEMTAVVTYESMVRHAATEAFALDVVLSRRLYVPPLTGSAMTTSS